MLCSDQSGTHVIWPAVAAASVPAGSRDEAAAGRHAHHPCVSLRVYLPACCWWWLQRKRDALKDVVRGHVALKVQAIKELESTLELPDLGTEGWNVQLFRSIDSSECSRSSSSSIRTRTPYGPCTNPAGRHRQLSCCIKAAT